MLYIHCALNYLTRNAGIHLLPGISYELELRLRLTLYVTKFPHLREKNKVSISSYIITSQKSIQLPLALLPRSGYMHRDHPSFHHAPPMNQGKACMVHIIHLASHVKLNHIRTESKEKYSDIFFSNNNKFPFK